MPANSTSRSRTANAQRAANSTPPAPETKPETVTTTDEQAKPQEGAEHRYGYLLEKEPTALHLNYAQWIRDEVGLEMTPEMTKVLQIVCVTRGAFQASDANQKDLQSRKEAWAKQQQARKEAAAKAKVEQLKKLAKETGIDLKTLLAS